MSGKRPERMPLPPHWGRWQPRAGIRLKALTAEEAWIVAAILEDLLDAIWAFHGPAMADYQGAAFPGWDPAPHGCLDLPAADPAGEPDDPDF